MLSEVARHAMTVDITNHTSWDLAKKGGVNHTLKKHKLEFTVKALMFTVVHLIASATSARDDIVPVHRLESSV